MKKIEVTLKTHTWWQCLKVNSIDNSTDDVTNNEEILGQIEDMFYHRHHFICGDLCEIDITNNGLICLTFNEDKTENELREYAAILLYFISLCCGYNCEFKSEANIDGIDYKEFFTYAKEDKSGFSLYKNRKNHEISLSDISLQFGEIMYKLYTLNRRYILTLLSNYYSLVVYKDFIGNGEYLFRNIISNVESIITSINEETYTKKEEEHKKYIDFLKSRHNISKTQLKEHLIPKSITLKEKLMDAIIKVEEILKVRFKFDLNTECDKIANTRNFISHVFSANKVYLSDNEISTYRTVFAEIFRILFLYYLNIDISLIYSRFIKNKPMRLTLSSLFEIYD